LGGGVDLLVIVVKHDITDILFLEVMNDLYNLVDEDSGIKCPLISDKHLAIINKNADRLNSAIVYDRDFNYNYFGFKVKLRFKSSSVD